MRISEETSGDCPPSESLLVELERELEEAEKRGQQPTDAALD